MRLYYWILSILTAVLLSAPAMAANTGGQANVQQSATGVAYVSGGVGRDAAAATQARYGNYSFKLINVTQGEGAYLVDVNVTVSDSAGNPVLASKLTGPWLLADLSAGDYRLSANFEGQTQTRAFSIAPSGQERMVLRWHANDQAPAPVRSPSYGAAIRPEDRAAPASQAPVTVVPAARAESRTSSNARGNTQTPGPARAFGAPANTAIRPQDRAAPASAAPVTTVPPAAVDRAQGTAGTNRSGGPTSYSTATPAYRAPVNSAIPWEDRAAPASQAPVTVIPAEQVEAIQSRNKKPAEPKNYNRPYPGSPASGY